MNPEFNAHKILEIAEQIERNGVRFYRNAARLFEDRQIRNMFNNLATWEAKHQEVFAAMREKLPPQGHQAETAGPDDPAADPTAMAGLAVFGIQPEAAEKLTGKETRGQVLKMALEREKDSIVFYTGLKDFVPARRDRDKIAEIVTEEMRHIRILSESLDRLD